MKRFAIVIVVLLCALSVFPQSRNRRRPAAPTETGVLSIFQIDFRNYSLPLNGKSYKLIDGFYAETLAPNAQWELAIADGPFYVDLTGDRKEEAVFVLRYGPVAAPDMAEARVYTVRNGKPGLLATFPINNAVSCEMINYIKVEDGTIIIERITGDQSRCDHNEITQYRWNGRDFMQVGEVKRTACRCI